MTQDMEDERLLNPIFRSLTRPVLWMGMERVPGALLVLGTGMLTLTGLMFAGDYVVTALVVAVAAAGMVGLKKLAERDPQACRVILRRLQRRDIYPARKTTIAIPGRNRAVVSLLRPVTSPPGGNKPGGTAHG